MDIKTLRSLILFKMAIRKQQRKAAGKYVPVTVNIRKLCEQYHRPAYYEQIRDKITQEILDNADLGGYAWMDAENLNDILLDKTGIFIFSEILEGYFPQEDIFNLYRYICLENKSQKIEHDIRQLLRGRSRRELRKLLDEANRIDPTVNQDQAAGREFYIKILKDALRI